MLNLGLNGPQQRRRGLFDLKTSLDVSKGFEQAYAQIFQAAKTHPARHVFTKLFESESMAQARVLDTLTPAQRSRSPLLGWSVSVKDLYDIAGEVTLAGTRVLAQNPSAKKDAAAVQRLRGAGALIIGQTNMTELAFSGVGINPHYNTPVNPCDEGIERIPGGSSSGAAVSVALGLCKAALGSDTGGSIRIPAALCGLVGFKATQSRVPLSGTVPLAPSLDTACAMTQSVEDCIRVDQVLSAQALDVDERGLSGMRFLVPSTVLLDQLSPQVAHAFDRTLACLSRQGAIIEHQVGEYLAEVSEINQPGGLSPIEAWASHATLVSHQMEKIDARVVQRLLLGRDITVAAYWDLLRRRGQWIERVSSLFEQYDGVLCPTVPMQAPAIGPLLKDDALFAETNRLLLRNTFIFNFLDGCSISLPMQAPDELPMGLMISGARGRDARVLKSAWAVERALSKLWS